ncbi:MAG TPA: DUF3144 domain-containing protein [Hyphomicrobiaceae bacterium]|nr:DUF3144 domain-containing protein [Hyphomicrobiaceae bacterium]
MPPPNRQERRAQRKEGVLDTAAFLKLAGKFIDLANRENQRIPATELHMAFLWAAARYNAHVAKAVLDVDNHEQFVTKMADEYKEMLRQNLADPGLGTNKDEGEGDSDGNGEKSTEE